MSELDPQQLRRTLLLEQAINRRVDDVVAQASQTAALLKGHERMEESQLRNLLDVAVESRSVAVVVNFIRYQIARSGSAWGTGRADFGHTVIADLHGAVKLIADKVVEEVREQSEINAQLHREVHVQVMQLYLGYLNRAFYYGKKTGDFDVLKAEAEHIRKEEAARKEEADRSKKAGAANAS